MSKWRLNQWCLIRDRDAHQEYMHDVLLQAKSLPGGEQYPTHAPVPPAEMDYPCASFARHAEGQFFSRLITFTDLRLLRPLIDAWLASEQLELVPLRPSVATLTRPSNTEARLELLEKKVQQSGQAMQTLMQLVERSNNASGELRAQSQLLTTHILTIIDAIVGVGVLKTFEEYEEKRKAKATELMEVVNKLPANTRAVFDTE